MSKPWVIITGESCVGQTLMSAWRSDKVLSLSHVTLRHPPRHGGSHSLHVYSSDLKNREQAASLKSHTGKYPVNSGSRDGQTTGPVRTSADTGERDEGHTDDLAKSHTVCRGRVSLPAR